MTFVDIVDKNLKEARKKILDGIKQELESEGIIVNSINEKGFGVDMKDTIFNVTYKKKKFKLALSHSGNSLSVDDPGISGNTSSGSVLKRKLDSVTKEKINTLHEKYCKEAVYRVKTKDGDLYRIDGTSVRDAQSNFVKKYKISTSQIEDVYLER